VTTHIERPKTVLLAVVLLAVSILYRAIALLSISISDVDPATSVPFAIGRMLPPMLWYALQAWLLLQLLRGYRWARSAVVATVALEIALRTVQVFNLAELSRYGSADFTTSYVLVALTSTVELVACALLFVSTRQYFVRTLATGA
jgi:hypothetical protein